METSRGRGTGANFVALSLALALAGAWIAPASAQESSPFAVEGHVIQIEETDIVVDLAGKRGAVDGDTVQIWRPLRLKHPVTGRMVTDRFLIGKLRLTQVRSDLALAEAVGSLSREPQAGDVVILQKERAPAAAEPARGKLPPPPGQPTRSPAGASAPGAPLDLEAQRVTELFESLRGATVPTRIMRYENYVRKLPNSRFAPVLYEEAVQLRRLLALESGTGRTRSRPSLQSFSPPRDALSGMPLVLGVEIAGPAAGAILHSRRQGEVSYVTTPMTAAGPGYYTTTVAGERMQAPELDYFIEATTTDGKAVGVVASSGAPNTVNVEDIPRPTAPPRHETSLTVLSDYADWNNWKKNDWAWQTEGSFGLRFRDIGVRAVRSGFGVYRGKGGSLEQLDEAHLNPRDVGLTYGYLEGEFGMTKVTSIVARGVIGLRRDGLGGGAQAALRIGSDKKTNLLLGGEVLGGIGLRGITQIELDTFESFPIVLRTEVTNQPAGDATSGEDACREFENQPIEFQRCTQEVSTERGEIGARAIAQLGYRVLPGFVVAVRGSYQGRTINHAGPGFGGALSYTW